MPSWGGDHPDGPVPRGIPGFRGQRHRKGRHRGGGCLGVLLLGWVVLVVLAFVLARVQGG